MWNRATRHLFRQILTVLAVGTIMVDTNALALPQVSRAFLSPTALTGSPDGRTLYVAEKTSHQIAILDIPSAAVCDTLPVPGEPTGLSVSPDGETLYVTCADPRGTLCSMSAAKKRIVWKIKVGHGACSPVVQNDGKRIYVCNLFENSISVVDLEKRKEIGRVSVGREPIAAAITPDDALVFVAHHLPAGASNLDVVSSSVGIIDTKIMRLVAEIPLPNGSTCVKDVCISNDGRFAFVTHILARFHTPTTQLERGWTNTNAFSILEVATRSVVNTVLLDDVDRGAANPWGIACSPDGRFICVTHAGTHELSVIDLPALLDKFETLSQDNALAGNFSYNSSQISTGAYNIFNDLHFLAGLRRRVPLEGNGPRDVVVIGSQAYVANYFSDNLNIVDLGRDKNDPIHAAPLGPSTEIPVDRKGEKLFHDATLCFQGWQSCASCHPDGRVDGLNWDLLNDGLGNPKNTKSLLFTHATPPSMSTGVREGAEAAVRSGIRNILFMVRPEEDAVAIDKYLKSLVPVPSPYLERDKLNTAARRGRKLFLSTEVGCVECHQGSFYTDMRSYDVGTADSGSGRAEFDTPALNELWRTAPYLHDGRRTTLRDVLTTDNSQDKHGRTSALTEQQIADLEAFLLSL